MPKHANSTSFKLGQKQSVEIIAKRISTMKQQYALGLRKPPINHWTPEIRAHFSELSTLDRRTKIK
jgi:hypothetical protein